MYAGVPDLPIVSRLWKHGLDVKDGGQWTMPRKQDLSAQRLRKHIEMETNPLAHALGLVNDAALQGAAYKAAQEFRETDWDDVAQRSLAAHYALSLDDLDKPLKKAFKAFGLDPRNPFHWRKLLAYFSDAHFASQRRRGPQELGLMIDFVSSCGISIRSEDGVHSYQGQKFRISKSVDGLSAIQAWARHTLGSAPKQSSGTFSELAIQRKIVFLVRWFRTLPSHSWRNCVRARKKGALFSIRNGNGRFDRRL
jgi:hypothetical protein